MSGGPQDLANLTHSQKINTAVDFLVEVHGKNYNEQALKSYLLAKRKLTVQQVDEAFKIHKKRVEALGEVNDATSKTTNNSKAETLTDQSTKITRTYRVAHIE